MLNERLREWRRDDGHVVSSDRSRLDLARITAWLAEQSYWAQGRPREVVERSVAGSTAGWRENVRAPHADRLRGPSALARRRARRRRWSWEVREAIGMTDDPNAIQQQAAGDVARRKASPREEPHEPERHRALQRYLGAEFYAGQHPKHVDAEEAHVDETVRRRRHQEAATKMREQVTGADEVPRQARRTT